MRIFITFLLFTLATTAYASSTFEQAYKNARTPTQKIRVLFAELKAKDLVIKSKDEEIAKLQEQVAQRITSKEQELLDKILMLNASNEEKDKEIQRLGQRKVTDYERCDKDYWAIDGKDPKRQYAASFILSYNREQRDECLAGKR